jgi:hypothetical protein
MTMARVIDAKNSTFVGLPMQIRQTLDLMAGDGAAIVDVRGSNFIILDKPLNERQIRAALELTPRPLRSA